MRYDYVVILRRDNDRSINRISLGLCLLSIFAFIYQQVKTERFSYFLSLAAILVLGGIVFNFISSRKKKKIYYRSWLFLAGVFWLAMPYLKWVSVIFFLLAFLESHARYPLEIGFTTDSIIINQLFRKKYQWTDFNNIVLKDGLLTLDFSNNRIFQKETLEDDEPDADEDEFNAYCRSKLEHAGAANQDQVAPS